MMQSHPRIVAPGAARQSRFLALDGLRGVAALLVVLHHVERIGCRGDWANPYLCVGREEVGLLSHGYLCVDIFFMLSGFVITHVYEPRWAAGLGARDFARQRWRRLMPLMLAGILLGAAGALWRGLTPAEVLLQTALQALFVPLWTAGGNVYPLDGVQWSLLFELLANAAHLLILARLPLRWLAPLTGAALIWTGTIAAQHGGLLVGDTGPTLAAGFGRAAFPYLSGVCLCRLHQVGRLPGRSIGFGGLAASLVSIVVAASVVADWRCDLAVVAIAFPALLVAGRAPVAAASPMRSMRALGDLSYPLYALHLPLLDMLLAAVRAGALPALLFMPLGTASAGLVVAGSLLVIGMGRRGSRRLAAA